MLTQTIVTMRPGRPGCSRNWRTPGDIGSRRWRQLTLRIVNGAAGWSKLLLLVKLAEVHALQPGTWACECTRVTCIRLNAFASMVSTAGNIAAARTDHRAFRMHAWMVHSAAIVLGASTGPWEVFAGAGGATGFVPQLTSCARHASQSHKHKYGRARVHFDLCTRVLVAH